MFVRGTLTVTGVMGFEPPSWQAVAEVARPEIQPPDEFEPGGVRQGWQHEAASRSTPSHTGIGLSSVLRLDLAQVLLCEWRPQAVSPACKPISFVSSFGASGCPSRSPSAVAGVAAGDHPMEENQAARPNRREERKNHHPKEGKEGSTTPKERGKATPKKKETKHHHPSEDGEKLFCSEEVVEGSPTKRMGRKAGPPERRLKKQHRPTPPQGGVDQAAPPNRRGLENCSPTQGKKGSTTQQKM